MGKNVAIIGGGISGLACAQRLSESNDIIDSITVFDTGNRSCGGRASSRVYPKAGFEFDHAAQYFSVKDENTPFSRYCRAAIDRNELYVIDNDRYGIISPGNNAQKFDDDGLVRYASVDGFRAFVRHLEDSFLDVASDNKNKIERPQWVGSMRKCGNKKWVLANTQDQTRKNYRELGEYDFVVIAHNGKCAFNLMKTAVNTENANESPKILQALKASFGIKPREVLYKKRELVLSSIWSVNVAIGNLDEETMQKLDAFDGAHVVENERLAYIGNNTLKKKKKKKKKTETVREITLLSTPLYGKRNKCPQEAIPEAVANKVKLDLVTELEKTLNIAPDVLNNNIVFSKLQLWGAANGLTVANTEYLLDTNASVGVCGDWLTTDDQSPSVETGMHSGWLLAEAILNKPTENHLQVKWKPVQNASALGLTVPGADLPDPPPEEEAMTRNNKKSYNRQRRRGRRKPTSSTPRAAMPSRACVRVARF